MLGMKNSRMLKCYQLRTKIQLQQGCCVSLCKLCPAQKHLASKDNVHMTKQTWKGAQHPPVLRGAHARASEMSLHVLQTLDC